MGRGRIARLVGLLIAATLAGGAAVTLARAETPVAGRAGVHEGVASCAGSTCHSRPVASGLSVRQNELITWEAPGDAGAHSRAWRVLTEARAQAIAGRLGLGPAQ